MTIKLLRFLFLGSDSLSNSDNTRKQYNRTIKTSRIYLRKIKEAGKGVVFKQ